MTLAALSQNYFLFVLGTIFSGALLMQQPPLLVHIYTENYAPDRRGYFVARTIVLSSLFAIGFSYIGGKLLDWDITYYHFVFLFMALAILCASFATNRIPSTPLPPGSSRNPLKGFSYVWKDKIFGSMLVIWMFLGFGNLIVLPLQVEFMVKPRFGIEATNTQVALAIGIIPLVSRILTTQIWGYLYDRYNFFLVRGMISSAFGLGHLIFFNSHAVWSLYIAGAFSGIGAAGAQIAWSLWVTKFAPSDKASEYMAVHTFFTGFRGILAPFIGFYIVTSMSAFGISLLSVTLVSISILLLIPLKRVAEKQTQTKEKNV